MKKFEHNISAEVFPIQLIVSIETLAIMDNILSSKSLFESNEAINTQY